MTLADMSRGRKAAVAATAAAVSATVAVTGVLLVADNDAPKRTADSLGAEPTEEPSPDAEVSVDPEPTEEPTEEPTADGSDDPSAAPRSPRPKRTADTDADVSESADPEPYPTAYCTTYPAPDESQPPQPEPSSEPDPSPQPSPDPTSTEVRPTESAPPSASASSPARAQSDPAPSSSPTRRTYTSCVVPGRPLHRDGATLLPDLRRGEAELDLPLPNVAGLDPRDRAALAELWTTAARGELASVPAFSDLALVLSALGAPLDLIARATAAALDEVDHTRRSFAIAGAYAGEPVEGGPVPGLLGRRVGQGGTPRTALTRLAVEALRDGCLMEGHAAAVARLAADTATDAGVRESLEVIADDEAGHAVLSYDVLAWCLSAGDTRLRNRITKELAALPSEAPEWPTADGDPGVLAGHGWPDRDSAARVYDLHRTAVVARVEGLLVGSL